MAVREHQFTLALQTIVANHQLKTRLCSTFEFFNGTSRFSLQAIVKLLMNASRFSSNVLFNLNIPRNKTRVRRIAIYVSSCKLLGPRPNVPCSLLSKYCMLLILYFPFQQLSQRLVDLLISHVIMGTVLMLFLNATRKMTVVITAMRKTAPSVSVFC